MNKPEVVLDPKTASKEDIETYFMQQRDQIMMQIVRLMAQLSIVNGQRFAEDPIILDIDFTRQIDGIVALPDEQRLEMFQAAIKQLHEIENPNRIITPDQIRAERSIHRAGH